ncbi:MAG: hypothetical protein S4CHLAM7_06420 [Chlamydiae bacterium]|nr:hypothetical protein [Chlamydiota bacterium]
MSDFNPIFFTDPFIRPGIPFSNEPTPLKVTPASRPLIEETAAESDLDFLSQGFPQVVQNLLQLPNPSVIVYRNGLASSVSKGPDIKIPIFDLAIENSEYSTEFSTHSISTYPEEAPFLPIADRFEIRFFNDSFMLTMTDGCGLDPSSRLAPKAAIEGFWKYLIPKIKEDRAQFDVHRLANYFKSAVNAAHYNIYWDAYSRSQEGFLSLRTKITDLLNRLDALEEKQSISEILKQRRDSLLEQLDEITRALEGDFETQKALLQKNLDNKSYEDFAGATTFMCSALVKGSNASDYPFYLLTLNLGDGQAFVFREGHLMLATKDTRVDLSNVRDPGGKIGLCSPTPLKMDQRNLQFSLTPCQSNDLLLFMTDGVLDNLNPERLGISPNGPDTPFWIQDIIRDAAQITSDELLKLLETLDLKEKSWKEVSLKEANAARSNFTQQFLEALITGCTSSEDANTKILSFCKKITQGHRDKASSNDSYYYGKLLGKPDHATCLAYSIP